MPNKKIGLLCRIKGVFLQHPWLKFISLVLAILVWFLVREQIARFNL
ncbi:MAG: hypothetical protein NC923_01985 [Candidatus Omnitrophica bacterium]|nr:hypothetical protein [Candidatus Omnitrophota bacterium]